MCHLLLSNPWQFKLPLSAITLWMCVTDAGLACATMPKRKKIYVKNARNVLLLNYLRSMAGRCGYKRMAISWAPHMIITDARLSRNPGPTFLLV